MPYRDVRFCVGIGGLGFESCGLVQGFGLASDVFVSSFWARVLEFWPEANRELAKWQNTAYLGLLGFHTHKPNFLKPKTLHPHKTDRTPKVPLKGALQQPFTEPP